MNNLYFVIHLCFKTINTLISRSRNEYTAHFGTNVFILYTLWHTISLGAFIGATTVSLSAHSFNDTGEYIHLYDSLV